MRGWRSVSKDDRLFTMDVFIIGGPMTGKFSKKNEVISRTIQIRGDQTLEDLHYASFGAFDREDEYMYVSISPFNAAFPVCGRVASAVWRQGFSHVE